MIPKYLVFSLMVIFLFSGCRSLERTTRHYRILTPNPLPAKPEGVVLPIIKEGETRRTYKVIGEMEFATTATDNFVLDALNYNGRIHGADAVLLQEWRKVDEVYVDWDPFLHHRYHQYACDTGYFFSPGYAYPQYYLEKVTRNEVRAQMIVFMDHDTFGFIGLVFEDVRNADYLEVAEVLPGTSAREKGMRPGDRVVRIGSYTANQGLQHYFKHGPLVAIGESVEIQFLREGAMHTVSVTGEKLGF